MNKNNILISISILLGCIILGYSIWAVQKNKQESIEKQQENSLVQKQEERCQELAIEEKQDLLQKNIRAEGETGWELSDFEYHYNVNTKMCVLAYRENELRHSNRFSGILQGTVPSLNNDGYIFSGHNIVSDLFTNKIFYDKTWDLEKTNPNTLDEVKKIDLEWSHIAELYFYQDEVRKIQ